MLTQGRVRQTDVFMLLITANLAAPLPHLREHQKINWMGKTELAVFPDVGSYPRNKFHPQLVCVAVVSF